MAPIHAERMSWLVLVIVLLICSSKLLYDTKAEIMGLEQIILTCVNGETLQINGVPYSCRLEQRSVF